MPTAERKPDHKGAARREAQVRHALEQAVKELGGHTAAAYRTGVTAQTIWGWLRAGSLDRVHAAQALKFARAAGVPLENLVIDATPRNP